MTPRNKNAIKQIKKSNAPKDILEIICSENLKGYAGSEQKDFCFRSCMGRGDCPNCLVNKAVNDRLKELLEE